LGLFSSCSGFLKRPERFEKKISFTGKIQMRLSEFWRSLGLCLAAFGKPNGLSKSGHHSKKQSILRIEIITNVNNNKCAPNLKLFKEKKMETSRSFFDRKLTSKMQISSFLKPLCHLDVEHIKKMFCTV
jgi:hypothetical protein